MTELETLLTTGLADVISAAPTTATIGTTAVRGVFNPGAAEGQLGMGGLVGAQGGDFTYLATAASAPSLLTVITVGGAVKRVASVHSDGGMITIGLEDPEDVR